VTSRVPPLGRQVAGLPVVAGLDTLDQFEILASDLPHLLATTICVLAPLGVSSAPMSFKILDPFLSTLSLFTLKRKLSK
jgi:hypothetical protein